MGSCLVLGLVIVDEWMRRYTTKYCCSLADLNPIGVISKNNLKRVPLMWASRYYSVLEEIVGTVTNRPATSGRQSS